MLRCCEPVAVPAIRWLGVLPSEFEFLDEDRLLPLSKVDANKLKSLFRRPYVAEMPALKEQLEVMEQWESKAEIQTLP